MFNPDHLKVCLAKKCTIQSEPIFQETEKAVHFYRPQDANGQLGNFYPSAIWIEDKIWPTTEHYFQAKKFEGTEKEERMRKMALPSMTFQAARQEDEFKKKDNWEQIKENIMLIALRAKFTQHEDLKQFILQTKDCDLIERSPKDYYWGDGADRTGKNRLGHLLMQVRKELQQQQQN